MSLVSFTLSMPKNNSWNGRWSGETNLYCKVVNLTKKQAERVLTEFSYHHHFGDGWVASITVKLVTATEAKRLRRLSKGFCGYDWMIQNIIYYGDASGKQSAATRPLEVQ